MIILFWYSRNGMTMKLIKYDSDDKSYFVPIRTTERVGKKGGGASAQGPIFLQDPLGFTTDVCLSITRLAQIRKPLPLWLGADISVCGSDSHKARDWNPIMFLNGFAISNSFCFLWLWRLSKKCHKITDLFINTYLWLPLWYMMLMISI